jgi:hypothetical protein
MATQILGGLTTWSMSRNRDGDREYKAKYVVKGDVLDGPATIAQTPGIALPGSYWIIGNDADLWATCKLDLDIKPRLTNEPNKLWDVEQTFSTKGDQKKCKDQQIDNPLLVPPKVSGAFTKYTEEAQYDINGRALTNSAHEQLHGSIVEFDKNRPSVKVEMNVAQLDLALISSMIDCVNDAPLWGVPARCVKLSNVTWERKFYGLCYIYYVQNFEFEIRYDTFDRIVRDEGTLVLNGHWNTSADVPTWVLDDIFGGPPDPKDPRCFIQAIKPDGSKGKVLLNGAGIPAGKEVIPGQTNNFVCIADSALNVPLTDGDTWVQLVFTDTGMGPQPYDPDANYVRGNLVTGNIGDLEGVLYIAVNDAAGLGAAPPGDDWVEIKEDRLDDEGVYDKTTTYSNGSMVSNATGPAPGSMLVQKYPSRNMLLLNIPTSF